MSSEETKICEKWAKFAAYWERIGKPQLEFKHRSNFVWQNVEDYGPLWHFENDYRIKGDRHHELRLKWVDSDFKLPVEWKEGDGNVWSLNTQAHAFGLRWIQEYDYREAHPATSKPTSPVDTGAHYRHYYRIKLQRADIEQGFVELQLDPGRIAEVYGPMHPMQFTALKKVLKAGDRGHKDLKRDIQDVIGAMNRWLEMIEEDERNAG